MDFPAASSHAPDGEINRFQPPIFFNRSRTLSLAAFSIFPFRRRTGSDWHFRRSAFHP
jgi:hypothetical protein